MFVTIQNGKSYQKLIFTLNGFNKDETRAEYDFFEGSTVGFPCVVHVLSVCLFLLRGIGPVTEGSGWKGYICIWTLE